MCDRAHDDTVETGIFGPGAELARMKIHAVVRARSMQDTEGDVEAFAIDLREISERYGFRLRSIGSLKFLDDRGQSNLVAVWERPKRE